jgi:hypothetical protein
VEPAGDLESNRVGDVGIRGDAGREVGTAGQPDPDDGRTTG